MEFTVSKSDLVRELGLSQGVVEKKTTIPILSNVKSLNQPLFGSDMLDFDAGIGDVTKEFRMNVTPWTGGLL